MMALMIALAGASCRFLSAPEVEPTTGPDPYVEERTLVFVPTDLPEAEKDAPYQVDIRVENVETFVGLFSVEEGALPPGLSLARVPSENRVYIVGTPSESGTFAFTLQAQCEGTNLPGQDGHQDYVIVVK
jgi:hypothetical protein